MAQLIYHGHSTATIELTDGTRILLDPWFDGNPVADRTIDEVGELDYIFCSHGHFDHFPDAIPLAISSGATLVATVELVAYCEAKGVENTHAMNIGGWWKFPFGRVKMTPAIHGGAVDGDETGRATTTPAGFLFHFLEGARVYFAGDTALTLDMKLLEGQVDVALLPIGDCFTMGPEDAVRAVDFCQPAVVIPIHYNTFPPIAQDPERFRALVGNRARVAVLHPGDRFTLAF